MSQWLWLVFSLRLTYISHHQVHMTEGLLMGLCVLFLIPWNDFWCPRKKWTCKYISLYVPCCLHCWYSNFCEIFYFNLLFSSSMHIPTGYFFSNLKFKTIINAHQLHTFLESTANTFWLSFILPYLSFTSLGMWFLVSTGLRVQFGWSSLVILSVVRLTMLPPFPEFAAVTY